MSKKILSADRYATGYGTHKFNIKYQGTWSDMDLITAVDNSKWDNPTEDDLTISHFGGYVRRNTEDTAAELHVYYD